jgi:hypothetical protein
MCPRSQQSVGASAAWPPDGQTPCPPVFTLDLRSLDRTHSACKTHRHHEFTQNPSRANFPDPSLPSHIAPSVHYKQSIFLHAYSFHIILKSTGHRPSSTTRTPGFSPFHNGVHESEELGTSSGKLLPWYPKGESRFEFPTGSRERRKNFYLYVSREGNLKKAMEHFSGSLAVHRWELKPRIMLSWGPGECSGQVSRQ